MIINKITTGFVIQKYDTKTGNFINQEFVCGDDTTFENLKGEEVEGFDAYLEYDMKQPKN
jgi:hypothetical protein